MNQLANFKLSCNGTITSIELVEYLNLARETCEAGIRHDHFMVKVPKILGECHTSYLGESAYGNNNKRAIYNFPKEQAELLILSYTKFKANNYGVSQEASLKTIEQILSVSLQRQYSFGKYRVDGYDSVNNVVYEIDDLSHRYRKDEDIVRQKFIEDLSGCSFVRINMY